MRTTYSLASNASDIVNALGERYFFDETQIFGKLNDISEKSGIKSYPASYPKSFRLFLSVQEVPLRLVEKLVKILEKRKQKLYHDQLERDFR
ncbi:hypothetical protein Bhyg_11235 [Pseudolycoriella hygida]|uniref:Uncharacterized protein n=1 Tax=Pseudolycoriella hygida TaxID=35572 RepID=A0A9Q0MWI9_9DIPT|nr:hypothetical protein Bhyg_11235 [Pseudolycoriella hygida]